MPVIAWNIEEIRKLVTLSEEIYEKAKKLEEHHGKKLYDGLMITMDLKGSSEAAIKYLDLQHQAAMPIVVLDEHDTWNVNKEFLEQLMRTIDPSIPFEKIIKETEPDPSKFVGRYRLRLGGAWGEIIGFYILNEPVPKIVNILYILQMAAYVTSFSTVTIPEIYTGSEEFLKLIASIDSKRGALEFLTRLLRRRYISEDLYAEAIEAVNRRHELTFTSLREEMEKYESRALMAEYITRGVTAIILKLQELLEKSGNQPVPREHVASIVGEVYTITRGLEIALEEYRKTLTKLNDLLTTSGKMISPEKIRKVIEELGRD
ncbi:MAG: hypothetical protein B6U89_01005 [Desulfurococcales archaeon ex4484_58]|nr:MAG: hypothetical protein B6U89_01005 [Desulfurococcales archaeon ex4484_58]